VQGGITAWTPLLGLALITGLFARYGVHLANGDSPPLAPYVTGIVLAMRPVICGLMSGIVADSTKVEEQPTTTRGLVEQTSKKLSKQVS
jgi:hypothetical protein